MSTLESRWRETGGYRLHVREGGAGDPVVLVHGLGVSGRYFEPLGRELARTFRVTIPDLPGWGESEQPRRALTIEQLADVVGELLAGEDGMPALVANSLGCISITRNWSRGRWNMCGQMQPSLALRAQNRCRTRSRR